LIVFAALIFSVLAVGPASSATPSSATSVEVARAEAEANAKTPAGRSYEGVVIGRVDEWLRPAVKRCLKDAPNEERISFDALVEVDVDGKAEEVVFGPETAVARCVAPDFRDAAYPRPPRPDWWVKVEVVLK
jgi:hypothetical protein